MRDLTFVQDTVAAFMSIAACEAAIGETVNVGSGTGIRVGELVRTILLLLGKDVPVVVDEERIRPESSEVYELVCDNGAAASMLGWSPTVKLEEGLSRTIDFVQGHPHLFKPGVYAR